MNCIRCRHKNPSAVGYCQRCGAKLDFTADEIQAALVSDAREEVVADTGFWARRALFLSITLFLLALTAFVLSTGAPEGAYYVPGAAQNARYLEVETRIQTELPKSLIPLEQKK